MDQPTFDFDESTAQPATAQGAQSTPAASSPSATPSFDFDESSAQPVNSTGTFNTPGGGTYTPGQSVVHSSGTQGEIAGQNPQTKNAEVKWHLPDAKSFKVGQMITYNGKPGTVKGYANNGKLLIEGPNGDFGGTQSVSPADVSDPDKVTSAASGFANSVLGTAAGALHFGGKFLPGDSHGLDDATANTARAQEANSKSGEAGHLIGDLVQFLAANGIVKTATGAIEALPAVEQYTQATKIAKTLADHPLLRKILHAGINGSLTQGGLSGVQSGGDPVAAAKGAVEGGIGNVVGEVGLPAALEAAPKLAGGVADALGTGIQKVGSAIAHPIDTAGNLIGGAARLAGKGVDAAADIANDAAEKYIPEMYPKEVEVPSNVQQAKDKLDFRMNTQASYDQHASDIRKAFVNGLKDQGIDLQIPPDVDVRKLPDLAKAALKNEYQPLYGKVDEALEKEGFEDKYQTLEDNLDNARDAAKEARKNSAAKPEGVITANKGVTEARAQLDEANAILKEQGLDGAVKRASGLYKASKAADEFKTKVLSHTQDLNGVLPRTNPNGFNKALNNLKYKSRYGSNRLDQLFGEKAGSQLMQDTRAAQQRVGSDIDTEKIRRAGVQDLKTEARQVAVKRAKVQSLASGIAKTAVGGGVGGAAIDLLK